MTSIFSRLANATLPIQGNDLLLIDQQDPISPTGFTTRKTPAFQITGIITTVSSIALLRTRLKNSLSPYAFVLGYYTSGDGGGGTYWYDPTDTTSSDNGGTIIVASDGGRWKLIQMSPVSVKQFGAKGDNATDDTGAIQAAINAVAIVRFPASANYVHASTLTMRNGVTLLGDGTSFTQVKYTGTGHQLVINNGINSSVLANISIRGIYFNGPNMGARKANIFDTGSSQCSIEDCFLNTSSNANSFGLILNQSELWTITRVYFAGPGHGTWVVNGADLSPGASIYLTNRIKWDSCQFNVTGFPIIDDGGISHTVDNCNWNDGTTWIRVAGVDSLIINGGEWENCTDLGIIFRATKWQGAAGLPTTGCVVFGAAMSQPLTTALFDAEAASLENFTAFGNEFNTAGTVFSGMDNCVSVHCYDNVQAGTGDGFRKINNVYSGQAAALTFSAAGGGFVLGNGTIVGTVSRCGRDKKLTFTLVAGSTTVFGTGNFMLAEDETSAGLGEVASAMYFCAGAFYTGVMLADSPAGSYIFFSSSNTGTAVSATVPASWASNSNNKIVGTINTTTTHQLG